LGKVTGAVKLGKLFAKWSETVFFIYATISLFFPDG